MIKLAIFPLNIANNALLDSNECQRTAHIRRVDSFITNKLVYNLSVSMYRQGLKSLILPVDIACSSVKLWHNLVA